MTPTALLKKLAEMTLVNKTKVDDKKGETEGSKVWMRPTDSNKKGLETAQRYKNIFLNQ